jgi:hypothetical protein
MSETLTLMVAAKACQATALATVAETRRGGFVEQRRQPIHSVKVSREQMMVCWVLKRGLSGKRQWQDATGPSVLGGDQ